MLEYSKPLRSQTTQLGKIFFLNPRERPDKPNRILKVAFDQRLPLIPGFQIEYVYWVQFTALHSQAGSHYHKKKSELFYPVNGHFSVTLEHPETRVQETIPLQNRDHVALY